MNKNYRIIYEDEAMLVCHKRAGVAVQSAGVGTKDLESMVRTYLVRKSGRRDAYLGIVHRLDQPVEGLVVFARTKQSAAHLSEQIKNHTAEKYYLAVTEGEFAGEEGMLEDYLKKQAGSNLSEVVEKTDKDGKKACLEYRVRKKAGDRQLVEIHLLTGRHHQIRVQLSHAGHPIVGDRKYNPACRHAEGRTFPALCAARLVIKHPVTGEIMQLETEPEGKEFKDFQE